MERKLLDMMNQLSISEYNPRLEYCDKFQICRIIPKKHGIVAIRVQKKRTAKVK